MPWMESSVTAERLRFVARVGDGEAMTGCAGMSDFRSLRGTGAGGAGRTVATPGVSLMSGPDS
jgi:hypothetical protein